MQDPREPGFQVVINGHGATNGAAQRFSRPLSVDEALQYSPMTSAPVFGLDSILRPDVGQTSTSALPSTHDQQAAGKLIDALDDEIRSGQSETSQLETSQQYLQQLLDGDGLTEYKFKLPSFAYKAGHSATSRNYQGYGRPSLGPFAKMVLESTDIAYRYPTPISPDSEPKKVNHQLLPTPVPAKLAHESNQKSFAQNNDQFASYGPTEIKPIKPSILIPSLPETAAHDEYKYIPDQESPKRRKLNTEEGNSLMAVRLRAQKEEADAALVKVQEILLEVFEAEDQLQPDTSSASIIQSNKIFSIGSAMGDHDALILSSETHSRLQKAMQKVIGYGRLNDIPTEYLNRLQKLCEAPILSIQEADIKLEHISGDTETENWLRKLDELRNGLLATGTLLQTMSGDRSEKELCPEDLIQAIPAALSNVLDNCIIPVVESRPTSKESDFALFLAHRQMLGSLTHQAKKALTLLAGFLSRIEVTEGTITAIEFLATRLIFVENAFNDKESALGFQKFESVRRVAMDLLARIFAKYPDQRECILGEILVSLEKLPSTRQNARQFKLIDSKNIQMLSALVMQLVQTTALQSSRARSKMAKRRLPVPGAKDLEGSEHSSGEEDDGSDEEATLERLATRVNALYDNSARSAQYITKFIVQRAMTSSKTGDQPYRNLLDLFTEDLISVLGSTDWPAAELLLRCLAFHMIGIAEFDKSTAVAKNMALELLGWMGSAISDLAVAAQHLLPSMDENESNLTEKLRQLFDDQSRHALQPQDLVPLDGPYSITLNYLQERDMGSWQLSSARGFYLAQWAKTLCSIYYDQEKDNQSEDAGVEDLASTISEMLSDSKWLESHSSMPSVPTAQARFAYILTVLNMDFCKTFDAIVKVLLKSITSDQAKVRSRSLKSVIQMLEKDPNLLDRDPSIIRVILNCAADSSPMVRDSAMSLIAKCITLKPWVEEEGCRTILTCSSDPAVGVRKRCIGLLKEIYIRTPRKDLKLSITDSLLQRTKDHEEGVSALARQVFEEVWLTPFYQSIDSIHEAPKIKVSLGEQVSLIVDSVQRSEAVVGALEVYLKSILHNAHKSSSGNYKVCKAMVAVMFERMVDSSGSTEKSNQHALLQTITVFAKSNARLLTPDQLETLQPYIGHLVTPEDLMIFRSVVVIYRCVLPYLTNAHNTLLKDVQNDLFKTVSRLPKAELDEVMACLWTINAVLKNTERIIRLTISVLKGVNQAKNVNLVDEAQAAVSKRVRGYVRIAGCVGKHCDLEKYQNEFRAAFPSWKGGSVAGLMVDFISPFTTSNQPDEVRVTAYESLGSICQTWPAQFSREGPRQALLAVFDGDTAVLQNIVLKAFADFFAIHEGKLDKLVQTSDEAEEATNSTRLGGSLKASENDGAAALIAQNFLQKMLGVAISRQDGFALTAIELIASINRQGLVHPKECAGVLVALETSTNGAIAKMAFETHKMLHQQHESMFEREYMRAIQEAFYYQRDIVGDSMGATVRPYTAKLGHLFEIVRTSNSKYQRKFLANLCAKVDFEPKKLDVTDQPPEHLLLARFVSQNLAFFEYGQLAELLPTIACMERIVAATGTIIAHTIESEVFSTSAQPLPTSGENDMTAPIPLQNPVDPAILKQVTTAAGVLSMLWEARTHLRRLYGIHYHAREKPGKNDAKELNRAPTKVHGVTGDKLWETMNLIMGCLDSPTAMLERCREFATLLSIDDELKVSGGGGDEEEGDSMDAPGDLDEGNWSLMNMNGSRPMKRKGSVSAGGTPKKARGRGRPSGSGKKRPSADLEDPSPEEWF